MYLIDTNLIRELRKGKKANRGVQEFWQEVDPDSVHLPVQTIGEIRRGIENIRHRGDQRQSDTLEQWLASLIIDYAGRILAFDRDCAQVWGKLTSPHNQNSIDKQIAAIALVHELTVVTRNTNDFAGTGVLLINPFSY